MELNLIVLAIPMYFILIGVELVVTRIQSRKLYRLNDALTNISCGITEQVSGVFGRLFTLGMYSAIYSKLAIFELPADTMSRGWQVCWVVVLFFGVDLCYYWAHRMSHEINLFWAGHVVHHQSEDYNYSVALRQGAFQKVFTSLFYLPLAFIGFRTDWFLIIASINTLYQFWIHTETIGKLGFLEWFMNTPSHHRVHHGRDPKYIDKNHAGVFIIWDRMFGTFQEEEERPVYGITQPAATFNPVLAQVQHFGRMWQDLVRVPGLWNKIQLIFRKPGWLPESLGGYRAPQEVDKRAYRKYDVFIPPGLNYYLFAQYVIALGGTAVFLFSVDNYSPGLQILFTTLIFVGVMSLGLLFEARKWAFYLEYGRILLTAAILIGIFKSASIILYIAGGSIFWAALSTFWLSRFQKPVFPLSDESP